MGIEPLDLGRKPLDSRNILASLETSTKNEVFDQVISDLTSMITQVILTFGADSKPDTYDKMNKAGEHINPMLFKGDLVLSGVN